MKVIFLHLPKTAGFTMHGIVLRQYKGKPNTNILNNQEAQKFRELPVADRERNEVVMGHMAFGLHTCFSKPEEVSYFTLLRDPVKRVISHYYYILKRKTHHLHDIIVDRNYSLKDYVDSGVKANTENLQVRLLSDNIEAPHGTCTREMLEIAKSNLEKHFSVVGLTEYFDETVLLIQQYYGWKTPYYARDNVTGHGVKPEHLDPETLQTIQHYNQLDMELYLWAKKRLEDQIQSGGEEFQRKLSRFRKKNGYYQRLVKAKRSVWSGLGIRTAMEKEYLQRLKAHEARKAAERG